MVSGYNDRCGLGLFYNASSECIPIFPRLAGNLVPAHKYRTSAKRDDLLHYTIRTVEHIHDKSIIRWRVLTTRSNSIGSCPVFPFLSIIIQVVTTCQRVPHTAQDYFLQLMYRTSRLPKPLLFLVTDTLFAVLSFVTVQGNVSSVVGNTRPTMV